MRVFETLHDWQAWRQALEGRSVGFVPTMGALHAGHASLIERCRAENEVAVVSIFVNPSQFNDPRDLERYPRDLDRDLLLLEQLGTDGVIVPAAHEIYPQGYGLRVELPACDLVLEAAYRPGFLQGVATVVMKLLNLVRAERAYYGEKDYQQLMLVTALTREFFLPTEIVACPTIREESGLALSSRNTLLSSEARAVAPRLFAALSAEDTCALARERLEALGFIVEYVEERWSRRLAAAYLDGVRLIDNVALAEIAEPSHRN